MSIRAHSALLCSPVVAVLVATLSHGVSIAESRSKSGASSSSAYDTNSPTAVSSAISSGLPRRFVKTFKQIQCSGCDCCFLLEGHWVHTCNQLQAPPSGSPPGTPSECETVVQPCPARPTRVNCGSCLENPPGSGKWTRHCEVSPACEHPGGVTNVGFDSYDEDCTCGGCVPDSNGQWWTTCVVGKQQISTRCHPAHPYGCTPCWFEDPDNPGGGAWQACYDREHGLRYLPCCLQKDLGYVPCYRGVAPPPSP
jgi:hypothetical protein